MPNPSLAADLIEAVGVTAATVAAIGAAAILAELVTPRAQANRAKLAARRRAARRVEQARKVGLAVDDAGYPVVPFRAGVARPVTLLELCHVLEAQRLRRLEADGIFRVLTPADVVRIPGA